MPARKYLIVDVQAEKYMETFSQVIQDVIPQMQLKLCGAVCDFTDSTTGKNKLFFPIQECGEKNNFSHTLCILREPIANIL